MKLSEWLACPFYEECLIQIGPYIMSKHLKFVVYKEGKYYVAQGLNVDVSSFDKTIEGAVANLREAIELYLEGEKSSSTYHTVGEALIGEMAINA